MAAGEVWLHVQSPPRDFGAHIRREGDVPLSGRGQRNNSSLLELIACLIEAVRETYMLVRTTIDPGMATVRKHHRFVSTGGLPAKTQAHEAPHR